jgi:flagellar motility protein MotE (MotC chaperone)
MHEDEDTQSTEEQVVKRDADVGPKVPSPEQIALQSDLEKFTKEINAVQQQMDALEARKQELFRLGVRLEGVLSYIKTRLGELSKT